MSETTQGVEARVIVIPRQLEGFFYERLTRYFAGRSDVRVIVDRRDEERRHDRWVCGSGPLAERRLCARRNTGVTWAITDMPFSTS